VHLPAVITLTTTFFTPRGWIHALLYVLFENAMGIVKVGAAVAGVLHRICFDRHAQSMIRVERYDHHAGKFSSLLFFKRA
jgi:hypothetical protein